MFKQLPSRNHRSKGLKVKHVLQICVLLAVCIWLIYQVKHSHEKRREFETKDGKVVKLQSHDEIQRFGRKDIPRITEITTEVEKNQEEDEEKEGEDDEDKHEDDETEREDIRLVEREDDERGVGDDEIDEHEPEKTEIDSEHEEETADEDKEKEEKEEKEVSAEESHTESEENEDTHEKGNPEEEENEEAGKEDQTGPEENEDVSKQSHNDREIKSDEQDHVAERTNTREAQEELYKADDASSEVTHNVQSVIPETENSTMDRSNEIWGKVNFGLNHETNTSANADGLIKPEVQPKEVDSGISDATSSEQSKKELSWTKSGDVETTSNSTDVGGEHSVTFLSNGTDTKVDSNMPHNGTIELPSNEEPNLLGNSTVKLEKVSDEKHLQEVAENAKKAANVNTNNGESQSSRNSTLASSHVTNDNEDIEAAKDSSVDNESHGEKPEISEKGISDESSESHSDEGTGTIQHDPIDASDITTLTQEEKESRTDLDTLPEIRSEVQNTEDTVAE